MSLDLSARRIVIASLAYYGLDTPLFTDAEYDAMTREVATGWDDLSSLRKWQLGGRDMILTTGNHVKVTQASWGGTTAMLRQRGEVRSVLPTSPPRRGASVWSLPYWLPADFRFA